MIFSVTGVLVDGSSGANKPSSQTLTNPQGDDAVIDLTVINTAGVPVNITNFVIVFTVKKSAFDTTALISRLATITNGPSGLATIQLTETDTASLSTQPYAYDIWMTDLTGHRDRIVPTSIFNVDPAVGLVGVTVTTPTPPAIIAYGLPALDGVDGHLLGQHPGGTLAWIAPSNLTVENGGVPVTPSEPNLNFDGTLLQAAANIPLSRYDITAPGLVPKTFQVIAGTGLAGGGALSGNVTLSLPSVGTAGTYTSVTTDAQGRVISGTNPTETDFYQTIKNGSNVALIQRPTFRFSPNFTTTDNSLLSYTNIELNQAIITTAEVSTPSPTGTLTLSFGNGLSIQDASGNIEISVDASDNVTLGDSGTTAGKIFITNPLGQVLDAGNNKVINLTQATATTDAVAGGRAINTTVGQLTGGGNLTSDRTLGLATTGVSPGTYTSVTVDSFGRVTAGSTPSETDFYQTFQSNGTSQPQEAKANFSTNFALTDSPGTNSTNLDLSTTGVTAGTYTSVTVDGFGRVTAGSSAPDTDFYQTLQSNGVNKPQEAKANYTTNFVLTDDSVNTRTTVDLSTTGVSAGTYTSVTVDSFGRVTSGTNPTETDFYQTIKNGSGTSQTQRANLKFGSEFSISDVSPDTLVDIATAGVTNAMLANSSITLNNGVGITGGGTVSLGGSLTPAIDQTFSPTWTGNHTFTHLITAPELESAVGTGLILLVPQEVANTAGDNLTATAGAGGDSNGSAAGGLGGFEVLAAGKGGAASGAQNAGTGGSFQITGGAGGSGSASGRGGDGGAVTVKGGNGANNSGGGAGAGAILNLLGGDGGNAGTTTAANAGGNVSVRGGFGGNGNASSNPGQAGGDITTLGGTGGNGGTSTAAGRGGNITLTGGNSGSDGGGGFGNAGTVTVSGGGGQTATATSAGSSGGVLTAQGGGGGNSNGTLGAGAGATGIFRGGLGGNGSGSINPGAGGDVQLLSGAAGNTGAGSANSGNVLIDSGTAFGAGTPGTINIGPTSTPTINIGNSGSSTTIAGAATVSNFITVQSRAIKPNNSTPVQGSVLAWDTTAIAYIPQSPQKGFSTGNTQLNLISLGLRDSYGGVGGTTPKVESAVEVNPTDYTVNSATMTATFRVVAAAGDSTVTAHAQLYNLTDGVIVSTVNVTGTTIAAYENTLTLGTASGNLITGANKIYELRVFVDSPSTSSDTIELYSAQLRIINTF